MSRRKLSDYFGILALVMFISMPVNAALDWEYVGSVDGVDAYDFRTNDGTIRFKFTNTTGNSLRVHAGDAIIWCGGTQAGHGDRQKSVLGDFTLGAYDSDADSGWNHYGCDKNQSYYLELNFYAE